MSLRIALMFLLLIGSHLSSPIIEAKPAADPQQDPEVTTDQEAVTKAKQEVVPTADQDVGSKAIQVVVPKVNQDEEPAQNKDLKPLENEAENRAEDQEAEQLLTEKVEPQAIKDEELSVDEDDDNKEDEEGVVEGDDEPTTDQDPECTSEWKSFQESCYYFGSSPSYLSWAGAASACKDLHENSTLPSMHSLEEDQYLQANTISLPFWLGASRNVGANYLLPSSWTWSDGTAMNYIAWAIGQPNNHWWGERCVRRGEGEGKRTWDDHKCYSKSTLAVVCKLKL